MKKLCLIFSILYMVLSILFGVFFGPVEPVDPSQGTTGGWIINPPSESLDKDETITPELEEIFNKGYAKYEAEDKVALTPIHYVGSQVVNGLNHKFNCVDAEDNTYEVIIWEKPNGECTATSVIKTGSAKKVSDFFFIIDQLQFEDNVISSIIKDFTYIK